MEMIIFTFKLLTFSDVWSAQYVYKLYIPKRNEKICLCYDFYQKLLLLVVLPFAFNGLSPPPPPPLFFLQKLNWLPVKIDTASGNEDKIVWSVFYNQEVLISMPKMLLPSLSKNN